MIKILKAKYLGDYQVELTFSDGFIGLFDGKKLLNRKGSLLDPLRDESFFKKFYIEVGALSWPHGLELSPNKLYQESKELNVA
jgi:hypothetical protein